MTPVYLTTHGIIRGRQRCGWPETTLPRMLERIVAFGAAPTKCPTEMGEWLRDLAAVHPAREFRVYGNHVFIFQPETGTGWHFITVLHVPRELLRAWHCRLRQWLSGTTNRTVTPR